MILRYRSKIGGMNIQRIFILFITAVLFISCNTTDPPEIGNIKISMTVEDVSCTEAWLRLTSENILFPYVAVLNIDSIMINITINRSDTTLYLDFLQPDRSYEIKIDKIKHGSLYQHVSAFTRVFTEETSSHNFIWRKWELGESGNSAIYDAVIINENNIWVVGEIYMLDSLGHHDLEPYNAAHWDGYSWELFKILFYSVCGQQNRTVYPAKSIHVVNDQEILIGMEGNQICRIRNGLQREIICLPWALKINKIWGSSGSNIYAAADGGNLIHYNAGKLDKIETGTTLPIRDIWGAFNKKSKEYEILCIASDRLYPAGIKIFRIKNNAAEEIQSEGMSSSISTIWFIPERKYLIGGDGFYATSSLQKTWSRNLTLPWNFNYSIRGEWYNDILVCGDYGKVYHNNGVSWYSYNELSLPSGKYLCTALKNNTAVCAGLNVNKAILCIGKRN